VRNKVDVIVTVGSAVLPAKHETSTIPIVFAIAVDPVGSGIVASLARPGGNVTGTSVQSIDLAGKRIELLRELLPGLDRLAVIADVGYSASVLEIGEVRKAAGRLAINVDVLEIRRAEDIAPAFEGLKSGVQALYVCPDALVNANHVASILWHWEHGYQQYIPSVIFSAQEVLCRMARTRPICSAARPNSWTRFSKVRNPLISRSSNRLSSS
jgi:ABC-type uncharacterized transport system substrate-binding protein